MGRRGPKPTPGKILELRGSWRAKSRKKHDPGLTSGAVRTSVYMVAPDWLSDEAKACWKQTIDRLRPLGILGKMDTLPLARYCNMHVQYIKAAQFVDQYGQTLNTKENGKLVMKLLPQFRIMMQLSADMLRLEQEFCMTPVARANFGIFIDDTQKKKPAEKNGKDRFFHDD